MMLLVCFRPFLLVQYLILSDFYFQNEIWPHLQPKFISSSQADIFSEFSNIYIKDPLLDPRLGTFGDYTSSLAIKLGSSEIIYNIPRNYIDTPSRFGREARVRDLLLLAVLPTVEGRSSRNNFEFRDPTAFLTILLQAEEAMPWDLARIARAYAQERPQYKHTDIEPVFGLRGIRQIPPNDGTHWAWNDLFWTGDQTIQPPRLLVGVMGRL